MGFIAVRSQLNWAEAVHPETRKRHASQGVQAREGVAQGSWGTPRHHSRCETASCIVVGRW